MSQPPSQAGASGRAFLITQYWPAETRPELLSQYYQEALYSLPLWEEGCAAVFQLERGEKGRLHIQAFVRTVRPHRRSAFRHGLTQSHPPHVECARDHRQSLLYCEKESTRVAGPYQVGDLSVLDDIRSSRAGTLQGKRTDLDEAKEVLDAPGNSSLLDLTADGAVPFRVFARNHRALERYRNHVLRRRQRRRPVSVHVRFGDAGTGKTYSLPQGPETYWKKAADPFFGGYESQTTIVLDDFHGNWFHLTTLLAVTDSSRPSSIKVYGDERPSQAEVIYITSNSSPLAWYNYPSIAHKKAVFRRITTLTEYRGSYPDVTITKHDPLKYLQDNNMPKCHDVKGNLLPF